MARAKTVELTAEISAKLQQWQAKSAELARIKEEEFALRQWLVFNSDLFDKDKVEGSQTLNIGNGWKLSADKVQNYSMTNENGEALDALNLLGSATAGNRPDLAQSLVRWKPDLSISTYRQVVGIAEQVPGLKEALAKAITIKQGAPQLELIPPKEGEKG